MSEILINEVYDRLMDQPINNFGKRECDILFGTEWNITQSDVYAGYITYKFESLEGVFEFYFDDDNQVHFIG